ncbi:hypothetical protein [Paraburkholderia aromaticivorans]|uniref:hypothetical protein n=1 Tax=Paraburkholderia aromaticivorans TaxID=2026199 RepID=UPI001455E064|nr:hypothetical protein [Paraburkholderia aromaticivorans]
MNSDIHAAMRIVNTETHRVISRLGLDAGLRIAMRARYEGRMEALLPVDNDRLRKLSEPIDPNAPIDSWEVELSVNGRPLLALSDSTMAAVANASEFAPIIRTMAQRTLAFVGDGPDRGGQHVAMTTMPGHVVSAADTHQLRAAAEFLAKQPGFEAAAALLQSILP